MELIQKTINAHIKHLNLRLKDDILYNGNIRIFTLPFKKPREALFNFLEGVSSVIDNKELWGIDTK